MLRLTSVSRSSFLQSCKTWTWVTRLKNDAHIAMTDDSSTIVCWHPENHFPYEKSLPIPERRAEIKSDSLLKVQSNKAFLEMIKPKRPEVVREELMQLTATTKHIWFPEKMRNRKKEAPQSDRPYL